MALVDYHCHLDLYPNFVELVEQYERERIHTLAVTTTPRAWPRNLELTSDKHYVKAALGLHPQLINNTWDSEFKTWKRYLPQAKYIGEIGIDGGKNFINTLDLQKHIFKKILELCAEEGNKVLSVHSVNSARLVLDLVEEYMPHDKGKIILHWFTGTNNEAKRALKLGCYFSINPKMLQTKKGEALISMLPIDRLLTETDGPFVDINIKDTVLGLATIKRVSTDLMIPQIENNLNSIVSST